MPKLRITKGHLDAILGALMDAESELPLFSAEAQAGIERAVRYLRYLKRNVPEGDPDYPPDPDVE